MADPNSPSERDASASLMGETAAPRDPDTGAAGTTNPRAALPAASASAAGVVPPGSNRTRWLVIAACAVLGIILILLLLT